MAGNGIGSHNLDKKESRELSGTNTGGRKDGPNDAKTNREPATKQSATSEGGARASKADPSPIKADTDKITDNPKLTPQIDPLRWEKVGGTKQGGPRKF